MKTIILAGGMGTRFSEETESKPKPMILIDDKPILWHIMSIYAKHGFCDFVIATGYKSEVIEEWVNFEVFPEWTVRTIFTGLEAQTGGRIKKCINELDEDIFFVTYGDGLGNVNVKELLEFHKRHGKASTVTAVRPPARFGYLKSINGKVEHFGEKNQVDEGWINGGFFVINREVESLIESDLEPFETGALARLVRGGELMSYSHSGFWLPMDTRSERNALAELARKTPVPWLS